MRCAAIICCSRVSRTLTRANSAATKNAFAAISKTTATIRSRANVTMKLKSYHRGMGCQHSAFSTHNHANCHPERGLQSESRDLLLSTWNFAETASADEKPSPAAVLRRINNLRYEPLAKYRTRETYT